MSGDALQIVWQDGTRLELVDGGQLSMLAFVNVGGVTAMLAGPLHDLVALLRSIASTEDGRQSDDNYGWTVEWRAAEGGGVDVAAQVFAGGWDLTVEGMTATHDEAIELEDYVDAFMGGLR